jgi:hypothetical protein
MYLNSVAIKIWAIITGDFKGRKEHFKMEY